MAPAASSVTTISNTAARSLWAWPCTSSISRQPTPLASVALAAAAGAAGADWETVSAGPFGRGRRGTGDSEPCLGASGARGRDLPRDGSSRTDGSWGEASSCAGRGPRGAMAPSGVGARAPAEPARRPLLGAGLEGGRTEGSCGCEDEDEAACGFRGVSGGTALAGLEPFDQRTSCATGLSARREFRAARAPMLSLRGGARAGGSGAPGAGGSGDDAIGLASRRR
mmetsp:Transcript_63687/g.197227  ORF Transcript_63687/g.197227 Transcript_63687/m.197227 type:complete len:225 (+) Transcript_63687:1886-2560(+)